jgi:GT2 family glycosyltransferase
MSRGPIRVEVVAPVHNRREITLQCLRSLSRLGSSGLHVHIVIVDDGSTDGTADAIRMEFPDVQIVLGDGNLWFTEGTNVGIRAALEHGPDYILTINDDSVFDENSLRYLVQTAEENDRSIVGPLLLSWEEPHKVFQVDPVWETWSGGWRHWQEQTVWTVPTDPWKVELIVGNCVLLPSEAVRTGGLMNSRRYPNFGDAEYTPRLKQLGWNLLIDPRARVFCQPNAVQPKIRNLPFRDKWRVLVSDLKQGSNLRRWFYSYWDTAPTRSDALLAFGVYLFRLVRGTNNEPTLHKSEPPIAYRVK